MECPVWLIACRATSRRKALDLMFSYSCLRTAVEESEALLIEYLTSLNMKDFIPVTLTSEFSKKFSLAPGELAKKKSRKLTRRQTRVSSDNESINSHTTSSFSSGKDLYDKFYYYKLIVNHLDNANGDTNMDQADELQQSPSKHL